MTHYWLFKTEPSSYGIEDLKRDTKTSWTGVRNFQARNMLRDEVKKGDVVLFYHSSCEIPGAYGVAQVVRAGYPDETQFEKKSKYFDDTTRKDNPRWYAVDIAFKSVLKNPVPLAVMRNTPTLADMPLLKRGNRLSLFPISKKHFDEILEMGTTKQS